MAIIEPLRQVMQWLLEQLHTWTGSFGLSIILLTVIIRLVLFPLTLGQTKSMQAMKLLQPKMQEIQKKYKEKPDEYQKRVMALYKENKVNPFGSCLLMLVQLPFMWGLFLTLQKFNFTETFILWELGKPDPTFVLPILAAVTTLIQSLQTITDPSQRTIMMIMPLFIGYLTIKFPTGLVIYWITSNLFSIAQQYFIARRMTPAAAGAEGK